MCFCFLIRFHRSHSRWLLHIHTHTYTHAHTSFKKLPSSITPHNSHIHLWFWWWFSILVVQPICHARTFMVFLHLSFFPVFNKMLFKWLIQNGIESNIRNLTPNHQANLDENQETVQPTNDFFFCKHIENKCCRSSFWPYLHSTYSENRVIIRVATMSASCPFVYFSCMSCMWMSYWGCVIILCFLYYTSCLGERCCLFFLCPNVCVIISEPFQMISQ